MSKYQFEREQEKNPMPENYHAEAAQQAAEAFEEGLKEPNAKATEAHFAGLKEFDEKWAKKEIPKFSEIERPEIPEKVNWSNSEFVNALCGSSEDFKKFWNNKSLGDTFGQIN